MKARVQTDVCKRWIVPKALFLGVVLAFLACCWAGHRSTQDSIFLRFKRFHLLLGPDSLFYPTVSQTTQYVRHHASRRQILVVIGGSSILEGTGQSIDELWSEELQSKLGDDYRVVNFAVRSGRPQEIGAIVAEILSRDYRKTIFVSDASLNRVPLAPDGLLYRYFFWDAYCKHLLSPFPERDEELRRSMASMKAAVNAPDFRGESKWGFHSAMEARREGWLDSKFYFNDLWNTIAYTEICTVWNWQAAVRGSFHTPRWRFTDKDAGPPPEQRCQDGYDREMAFLRKRTQNGFIKQSAGKWVENVQSPGWETFMREIDTWAAPALKPKILLLFHRSSPYYVDRLTVDEQAGLSAANEIAMRKLREAGVSVLDAFKGLSAEDYVDRLHLSGSGGARLAAAVAPKIREMAQKLGYIQATP